MSNRAMAANKRPDLSKSATQEMDYLARQWRAVRRLSHKPEEQRALIQLLQIRSNNFLDIIHS